MNNNHNIFKGLSSYITSGLPGHLFAVPETEATFQSVTNKWYSIKLFYGESSDLATAVFLGRYHKPDPPVGP